MEGTDSATRWSMPLTSWVASSKLPNFCEAQRPSLVLFLGTSDSQGAPTHSVLTVNYVLAI